MRRESRCDVLRRARATGIKFSALHVKSNRGPCAQPFVGQSTPLIGTAIRVVARVDIVRGMGAPRKIKGFTLMELMMTLAVVGVILAIAIPNFRDFLLNSRMTGAANDLLAGIQLARSEAIKRQAPVALCASTNPTADPPECAAEFTGWAVWADTDDDAAIDAGEAVIAAHEPVDATLTLISNGSGFVSYGPDGFSRPDIGGNASTNLVLLCDERANLLVGDIYRKRVVVLAQTGRPSVLRQQGEVNLLGPEAVCP